LKDIGFQDGGSDEVAVFIALNLDSTPIKMDLPAFISTRFNQAFYTGFRRRGDQGPTISPHMSAARLEAESDTYKSAPFSKPPFTFRALTRSMSSGSHDFAVPTKIAREEDINLGI